MKRWVQYAIVTAMLVMSVNLGILNMRVDYQETAQHGLAQVSQMSDINLFEYLLNPYQPVVDYRMPAVVSVHAEHATAINPYTGKPARMSAAGVVISEDGLILTASHVVDDLDMEQVARLWVVFPDGTERDVLRYAYATDRTPDIGLMWNITHRSCSSDR